MRAQFILALFLINFCISCGTTKPVSVFSKETVKDITGDCSSKQVGNYVFTNLTNEQIGVTVWNNPGKMGSGNYPQGITVPANSSQTLYDLKPGVYAFIIRKAVYGQEVVDGQFKVEVCKEKTYNHR